MVPSDNEEGILYRGRGIPSRGRGVCPEVGSIQRWGGSMCHTWLTSRWSASYWNAAVLLYLSINFCFKVYAQVWRPVPGSTTSTSTTARFELVGQTQIKYKNRGTYDIADTIQVNMTYSCKTPVDVVFKYHYLIWTLFKTFI